MVKCNRRYPLKPKQKGNYEEGKKIDTKKIPPKHKQRLVLKVPHAIWVLCMGVKVTW